MVGRHELKVQCREEGLGVANDLQRRRVLVFVPSYSGEMAREIRPDMLFLT